MNDDPSPVVPTGWTVVEFDPDDPYHPWCSEESPEEPAEDDDAAR